MNGLHVSISAESLFNIGRFSVTNSLLTSWALVLFLCLWAVRKSKSLTERPSTGQLLIEIPIGFWYQLTKDVAGDRAKSFFPYIATFFIYILLSNWIELIPGVGTVMIEKGERNLVYASESPNQESRDDSAAAGHKTRTPLFRAPSADLNMTLSLALFSVALIQYYGWKYIGWGYFKKFFSLKNPIHAFVGLLELISELAKIISFSFRLFGNIFAGEVLLVVMAFIAPYGLLAPAPFYALELFVGFIQALVFSMLTLVFLNLATTYQEH